VKGQNPDSLRRRLCETPAQGSCCRLSNKERQLRDGRGLIYVATPVTSDCGNQSQRPTNRRVGLEHGGQRPTRKAPDSNRNRRSRGHSPFLRAYLPGAILPSIRRRHRGANGQRRGLRSWQIQAGGNLLKRGALGRADALPALPVSVGDPGCEVEDEPLVVLKLLRRRLALEQGNLRSANR
jgi:hypothetical protein